MKFRRDLLLLLLSLCYISSVNAASVINCQQLAAGQRAKCVTAELSTQQQQYQQSQRRVTQAQQQHVKSGTQQQQESTPSPAVAPILSPLFPSNIDEDDIPHNSTHSCDTCCVPDQSPCQRCCDIRPLLGSTFLKSASG